ncbi:MAG TPA: glycoside hydrolase family 16 protein [Polyangiaceae bacterium]|jgi:beta-glucanase (GH16 family)
MRTVWTRSLLAVVVTAVWVAALWGCSSSSGSGAGPTGDSGAGGDARATDGAATDASTHDTGAVEESGHEASAGETGASDGGTGSGEAAAADGAVVLDGGWVLVWSDEFDSGTAPDPSKWIDTSLNTTSSGPGWGVEYDEPAASTVSSGNLVITATQGADGGITSGAIDSKGKFQQTYGRFEARMKAPPGAGVWPAFWLMGDTNGEGWPTCGEIDIVEIVGSAPKNAYGTVHSGNTTDPSQNTSTGGSYTSTGPDLSADFHVYAVEWSASSVAFYVDDNLYETVTPQTMTSGELWAFDHDFYILFDLALGGSWAGPPNAATFPATMLVDYVRVYQKP